MRRVLLIGLSFVLLSTSLFAWSVLWKETDSSGMQTIRIECNSGTLDGGTVSRANGGNYCTASGCYSSLSEAANSLCN